MVRIEGKRPTRTLWVFCEGCKTEKDYFRKLNAVERISRLRIKVHDCNDTDAVGVVKYAVSYKKAHKRDFEKDDLIFCVFDRDGNKKEHLEQCISIAKKNGITIVFSNPSFEYWILCHYGYFPARYENPDLLAKITEYLKDYRKNDSELYLKTKDKLDDAIKHAARIRKKHDDDRTVIISRESNPVTLVYELIQKIDEFRN